MDSTSQTNPQATDDQQVIIEDIFTALGVENISDSDKAQLFTRLIDSVQIRTVATIFEMLDSEKKNELEKIIDEEDGNAMNDFLAKNVPNHDEIFVKEAQGLRMELIKEFAA